MAVVTLHASFVKLKPTPSSSTVSASTFTSTSLLGSMIDLKGLLIYHMPTDSLFMHQKTALKLIYGQGVKIIWFLNRT